MPEPYDRTLRRRRTADPADAAPPAPPAEPVPQVPATAVAPAPVPPPAEPRRTTDLDALREVADMARADVAAMMEQFAPRRGSAATRPGQRVKGRVTRVTADTVFVDIGQKADASIARVELDAFVALGDEVDAFVLRTAHGELMLTLQLGGEALRDMLGEARESGIPVQGKVEKAGEHGFDVTLGGGVRAFCPISQMSGELGDAESWVGRTLPFRILDVRGREAVVSHRSFADEAAREEKARRLTEVEVGSVHDATVVTLREFGAFVRTADGIDGLVHISNLANKRIAHPSEVVKEGDTVRVRVLAVDPARRRVDFGVRQADTAAPPPAAGSGRASGAPSPSTAGSFGTFGSLLANVKPKK